MSPSTAQEGELLTRGALAARSGCNVETIRYYEHIGILPAPPRSQGGHRLYGYNLIKRLTFVRRSRDLGFTLEEIRQLLRLVDGGNYTCAQIETLALQHVRDIVQKITDLKKLNRCWKRWLRNVPVPRSPSARSSTSCSTPERPRALRIPRIHLIGLCASNQRPSSSEHDRTKSWENVE